MQLLGNHIALILQDSFALLLFLILAVLELIAPIELLFSQFHLALLPNLVLLRLTLLVVNVDLLLVLLHFVQHLLSLLLVTQLLVHQVLKICRAN